MASKFLRKTFLKHFVPKDPVFEYVEYYDKKGKKQVRKKKRKTPEDLSVKEKMILKKTSKWARRLDIRGIAFLIGLVPAVGDAINVFLGYMLIVRRAKKAGIPKDLKHRMYLNLAIQFVIGLIPFVGDVLIALWGANSDNVLRLRKFLEMEARERRNIHGSSLHG